MLDQAAAAGVVVLPCGGGPAEAVAPKSVEEMIGQCVEARVFQGGAEGADGFPIAPLLFRGGGIPGVEGIERLAVEPLPRDVRRVEAILVLRPLGIEAHHAAVGQALGGIEQRGVGPGVEVEAAGGVGEGQHQVGLAALGLAVAA